MTRHIDWPDRLAAYIHSRRELPFAWGVHDCVLFASGAIAAITGIDPAADFRGKPGYKTEIGALRALRRLVGPGAAADLLQVAADQLASEHGWPVIAPALARRGDVVLIETGEGLGEALAVVWAGRAMAPLLAGGLARSPIASARRAWAVAW